MHLGEVLKLEKMHEGSRKDRFILLSSLFPKPRQTNTQRDTLSPWEKESEVSPNSRPTPVVPGS